MIQGKTAKERGQLIEYLSGSGVAFCRKVKLVVAGKVQYESRAVEPSDTSTETSRSSSHSLTGQAECEIPPDSQVSESIG